MGFLGNLDYEDMDVSADAGECFVLLFSRSHDAWMLS